MVWTRFIAVRQISAHNTGSTGSIGSIGSTGLSSATGTLNNITGSLPGASSVTGSLPNMGS